MGTEKRERQKANRQKKMEELHRTEKKDDLRGRCDPLRHDRTAAARWFVRLVAAQRRRRQRQRHRRRRGGCRQRRRPTTETTTDAADSVDPMDPIPADCPPADGAPQALQFQSAPEMCIDVAKTYTAEVSTSMGDFTIALDPERAPLTVNNFVFLARYHYYDGATFHRVIPGFVIQGGDPVGDPPGIGGPGYSFADELPAEGEYELGSLAMANSGADTNGSQFFVITGDQGIALPPQYSCSGR
ncbi:MAG: peptidylprolyl isomerase [Acidimicrobiales bacterium]